MTKSPVSRTVMFSVSVGYTVPLLTGVKVNTARFVPAGITTLLLPAVNGGANVMSLGMFAEPERKTGTLRSLLTLPLRVRINRPFVATFSTSTLLLRVRVTLVIARAMKLKPKVFDVTKNGFIQP